MEVTELGAHGDPGGRGDPGDRWPRTGDRGRYRADGSVAAVLEELRAHKPKVLRRLALARPAVADALGGGAESSPSLLVEEFARAGLVVEVWSEVLGEAVVLASDDACVDPGEVRAVYRAHELRVLLAPLLWHSDKSLFEVAGDATAIRPRGSAGRPALPSPHRCKLAMTPTGPLRSQGGMGGHPTSEVTPRSYD